MANSTSQISPLRTLDLADPVGIVAVEGRVGGVVGVDSLPQLFLLQGIHRLGLPRAVEILK